MRTRTHQIRQRARRARTPIALALALSLAWLGTFLEQQSAAQGRVGEELTPRRLPRGSPELAPVRPNAPAAPQAPPPPAGPAICGGVPALSAGEAQLLAELAAAALAEPLTVAVVDRAGRVQALFRQQGADPGLDDRAVGLARTGAFFSNDQAPLSSRTVRFISGLHFPPGVARTPNAALYSIENTNRGCDLNVTFEPGQEVPPAASINGAPCNSTDASGCGTGPVTGKADPQDSDPGAVAPGGLPVFRGGTLVGGIGVVGPNLGDAAEFAALSAFDVGLTPIPQPLPEPGVIFLDGIRLPFVRQVERPSGSILGVPAGTFVVGPSAGGCVPDGYLVGPNAGGSLTRAEVEQIVNQAAATASRTRAAIRLPPGARTKMAIAVGDVDGEILALFRMPDATVFSIDVAVAKARNVVWFSSPAGKADLPGVPRDTAVTNRTINFGSQPLFPAGIDGSGPGPFFQGVFVPDFQNPCTQGSQAADPNQNGVVFFPGSIPLYKGRTLVGGLGISGDGVEQDDYVAFHGGEGFHPPRDLWADQVFIDGVRLPFLKFPRNPEE